MSRPLPLRHGRRVGCVALTLIVAACGERAPTDLRSDAPTKPVESVSDDPAPGTVARLGSHIFHDKSLSLQRNQSCASCHDTKWGFTSPNPLVNAAGAVMFGSVRTRFGSRKPPSAAYATQSPILHYDADDDTYVGGNFWDGRATGARLGSPSAEQALGPFLNPVEQALPDVACVAYRIVNGNYASLYAAAKLAEVEARSAYVHEIHGASSSE